MSRKHLFFLMLLLSLGMRLHMNLQGRVSDGLLTLPVAVLWMAFLLPVAVPVKFAEIHFLLFDPWVGDGHWLLTTVAMTGCASCLWFFPTGRVERWFGVFDAFTESSWQRMRRRFRLFGRVNVPTPWECAATVLDALRRLKVGNGKMGGWA